MKGNDVTQPRGVNRRYVICRSIMQVKKRLLLEWKLLGSILMFPLVAFQLFLYSGDLNNKHISNKLLLVCYSDARYLFVIQVMTFLLCHLPFLAGILAFQAPGLGSYSVRVTLTCMRSL